MIEKNSTGYPTLAVIQHFGLQGDPEAENAAYRLSHAIKNGRGIHQARERFFEQFGPANAHAVEAYQQLLSNHRAASVEFGYAIGISH